MSHIRRIRGDGVEEDWRPAEVIPRTHASIQRISRGSHTCAQRYRLFVPGPDDYLNLRSDEYHKNKSFAEDLTEGKFSYPIIYAIQKSAREGDHRLVGILKQRTSDLDLKKYAVKYMEELGAFVETKKVLLEREAMIKEKITSLGENPQLTAIIGGLMAKL